jgi:YD repeat-containing protein
VEILAAQGGDTTPPSITITAPPDGVFTNNAATVITGSLSEPATLTINGQSVGTSNNSFSYTTSLHQGANSFSLSATDTAGNSSTRSLVINLDTTAPTVPNRALAFRGAPVNGLVTVTGPAGAVEPNAWVRVTNVATGQIVTLASFSDGSYSVGIAAGDNDLLQVAVQDPAGNIGQVISLASGQVNEYDVLGRLTKVTYGDGSYVTYAYDAAGNRTTVTATKN